jgi:hypothetical protein
MIKSLIFLMSLCLFALASEDMKFNVNDKEIKQTFCTPDVKQDDSDMVIVKLHKCLRQKRQEKLTNKVKRSVTITDKTNQLPEMLEMIKTKFNLEKLIDTFKSVALEKKQEIEKTQRMMDNKLNIVLGIAEINDDDNKTTTTTTPTTEKIETVAKIQSLKCGNNQKIKVLSARLTSQNFDNSTCFTNVHNEKLEDLNEPCNENTQTMIKMIQICENKNECEVDIDMDMNGVCDCTQNKYLDVSYTCVEDKSNKREKRALHYRNRKIEIERERLLRQQVARAQGLDYILNNLNYNLIYGYPYGGYGYGAYGAYGLYGGYGGGIIG